MRLVQHTISTANLGTLSEKNGIMWEKIPNGEGGEGGSDPNPLLDVFLPSYFWHAKMAPNQSCMPLVVKKNRNIWETFPTGGIPNAVVFSGAIIVIFW